MPMERNAIMLVISEFYTEKVMMETGDVPKKDKSELKKKLTPLQYDVTQACGTEPPFKNEYWNNHK